MISQTDDDIRLTEETDIPVIPVQPYHRPHVLQQVRGPLSPQLIELNDDTVIVGRSSEAQIRVPSSALSRTHMRIERYQGGYRAIDLDSSNGVYLNQIRINSAVLRDGDTIQLGNAVFIYHEGK
ncbi:MAG: FHA domain-containing protein [Myxococcales bacterium]|nr:FHA domain-containing protein [Myxococcales bacterium]